MHYVQINCCFHLNPVSVLYRIMHFKRVWWYYYYYLLSPLHRIFTVIYLKQMVFLGYIMLQRFCSYNLWHMSRYATFWMFCIFTLILSDMCAVSNMAVFSSSLILCFPCVVVQVLSEWFLDGSSCPWYYYWFYIPSALYFCCKVFIL